MPAVEVKFQIGHEATLRTKPTSSGYTHDWELFVRESNSSSNISHFVKKVVFNLHETFPKPKRVIKEPPFLIKESGYAGFSLTVDIFFRNRDEPKMASFDYDLDLQQAGPRLMKIQEERFVFKEPSEKLHRKLVRGGGIEVGSCSSSSSGTITGIATDTGTVNESNINSNINGHDVELIAQIIAPENEDKAISA